MTTAENMIRVGVVSAVNEETRMARVIFPESGDLVSDWMFVIGAVGVVEEKELFTETAGEHNHSIPEHNHAVTVDNATVSVQNAGDHTHSVDSHSHSVTVDGTSYGTSSVGGSTGSAGNHNHATDAHNHGASTASVSQTANNNGNHKHQIPKHTHKITPWLPAVNDRVLCLMMCGDEADGYILGAIP